MASIVPQLFSRFQPQPCPGRIIHLFPLLVGQIPQERWLPMEHHGAPQDVPAETHGAPDPPRGLGKDRRVDRNYKPGDELVGCFTISNKKPAVIQYTNMYRHHPELKFVNFVGRDSGNDWFWYILIGSSPKQRIRTVTYVWSPTIAAMIGPLNTQRFEIDRMIFFRECLAPHTLHGSDPPDNNRSFETVPVDLIAWMNFGCTHFGPSIGKVVLFRLCLFLLILPFKNISISNGSVEMEGKNNKNKVKPTKWCSFTLPLKMNQKRPTNRPRQVTGPSRTFWMPSDPDVGNLCWVLAFETHDADDTMIQFVFGIFIFPLKTCFFFVFFAWTNLIIWFSHCFLGSHETPRSFRFWWC